MDAMTQPIDYRIASIADAAFVVQPDGEIAFANTPALELAGYANGDELASRKIRNFFPEFRQAWLSPADPPAFEGELKHREGGRIPVWIWSTSLEQGENKLSLLVIRERKIATETDASGSPILHGDAQLLASRVGHELANLLTPLLGYLELAKMDSHNGHAVLGHLVVFEGISRRIHIHVQNLLRIRRRGPGVRRYAKIVDAIESAINFYLESQVGKLHLLERVNFEVFADSQFENEGELLQHLLINVLLNAAESMQNPGTITLTAQSVDKDFLVVEIADRGGGIPKEIAPRIYDPFFTTKSQGGAAGLGLYSAKIIAERLGVAIQHFPNKDKGTVFQLLIRKSSKQK